MHRSNAIYFLAGLLIAGSVSFAMAASFGGADGVSGNMGYPGMSTMRGGFHHAGMMGRSDHWRHDPVHAVIMDMRGIQRLDRMSGHADNLAALYKHVLDTTQNPEVRHYAYMQLARTQMKPANVDQALATMHKSLDEDLARLDAVKKK